MAIMERASLSPHIENLDLFLRHCHKRRYRKHSVLIEPGDSINTLFYIISGSASVVMQHEEGREIIISYLNPGAFIGELGYFHPDTPRDACVRARTDCEVATISYADFTPLARAHPEWLYALTRQLARRLNKITRKVGDLAFLDVSGRMARTLMDLAKQPDAMTHPDGMQIKVTRQELGRIIGCSREMAGRVLKTLEEQGLVHAMGSTMVVQGARP